MKLRARHVSSSTNDRSTGRVTSRRGRPKLAQSTACLAAEHRNCTNTPREDQGSLHKPARLGRRLVNTVLGLSLLVPSATAAVVDEDVSASVFEKGERSIVTIRRKAGIAGDAKNLGTGVVWDRYGHIATNYHIIARVVSDKRTPQALEVAVWQPQQQQQIWTADAYVIASDAYRDLAVLQLDIDSLDTTPLTPIKAGPSSTLKVGQYLYCLGAPSPDNPTLTVGVMSGSNRSFPSASGNRVYGALQMDTTVNQDNSGGPVLDSFGRMVGLATATYSTATSSTRGSGINFALPMDAVREVVPNLIIYGSATGKA